MLRLLRWGTFFVLIAVVVGVLLSYPILRDRFFAPMLAAPAASIDVIPRAAITAQPTNTVTATTLPTLAPSLAPTKATAPAVIIQAPAPTATTHPSTTNTPTAQSVENPIPIAIATTSLLPANSASSAAITPIVLGPTVANRAITATVNSASLTIITTTSIGIAVPITPPTPTPTEALGQPAAVSEKGYEPPLASAAIATDATPTPILVLATPASPIITTPIVVTTVNVSPAISTTDITPMVVITLELTPQTGTPITLGPVANTNGPLYSGPDFNAAIVGQVMMGEQLLIIGIYTKGTWYLLANGMWLPGTVVDHAPLTLPLVFPTVTPILTNTPTITPTPLPTATPVGSATPSPTPTSLEAPVCDCSGDHLDCLGNIFANRAAAQSCFEYCFRQTGLDIHLLDPNLNGVACENLR